MSRTAHRRCAAATILLLSFGLSAGPSSAAVNLIQDGGFEGLTTATHTVLPTGATLGAWTVLGAAGSSNSGLLLSNDHYEAGPNVLFTPYQGSYAMDITGSGNTGPADGISQTFATTAGQAYTLDFHLGNAADGPRATGATLYGSPSSVLVSVGNESWLATNSQVVEGSLSWQHHQYAFTATGAQTTLTFLNRTDPNDMYAGIDAVSISAVPEPSTWATMGIGLAVVAAALRRRQC